jgi:hypothetical protein
MSLFSGIAAFYVSIFTQTDTVWCIDLRKIRRGPCIDPDFVLHFAAK